MTLWSGFIRSITDSLASVKQKVRRGAKHIKLGKMGEDLAVNALRAEGYKIAERNTKINRREIDIIATDDDLIVFIEVKTRSNHSFGKPLEAVTLKRRKRLKRAGELYLANKRLKGRSIRFDIVTIDFTGGGKPKIEIVKNAF